MNKVGHWEFIQEHCSEKMIGEINRDLELGVTSDILHAEKINGSSKVILKTPGAYHIHTELLSSSSGKLVYYKDTISPTNLRLINKLVKEDQW